MLGSAVGSLSTDSWTEAAPDPSPSESSVVRACFCPAVGTGMLAVAVSVLTAAPAVAAESVIDLLVKGIAGSGGVLPVAGRVLAVAGGELAVT